MARRRRNPMDILLEENPRRKRSRRNPPSIMPKSLSGLFQGVGIEEGAAAIGGLAAATMLPGYIVKLEAGATELTTTQKLLKFGVALGAAGLAGMIGKSVSARMAQFAVAGGLAGAGAQAIGAFTDIKIGGQRGMRALPPGGGFRRTPPSGIGRYPAPSREPEFSNVRLD